MSKFFRLLVGSILLLLGGLFIYAAVAAWLHNSDIWLVARSFLAGIVLFSTGIMTFVKNPWRDIFDFIMRL